MDFYKRVIAGTALTGDALTQIFVPSRIYAKGYTVEASGATAVSAPTAPWLLLRTDPGATDVTVTVSPANDATTQRPLDTGALPTHAAGPGGSLRACSLRRSVTFRLPRGARLRSVTVPGRRVKARAKRGRVRIRLVGRTGTVRVRIVGRTRNGKVLRQTRVFRTCAKRTSLAY